MSTPRERGKGGFCHIITFKKTASVWAGEFWMNAHVCVFLRCQVSERRWSGIRRCLLVADTKPLLCNQLSVKSNLRGPLKSSQRQGAGGGGGSAVTQLWAEPTHPCSIWALLISVATWPLFPPGPRTMEALGAPLLLWTFLVLPFSQNLKYFIRPPSVCCHSFATVL